MKTFAQYLTEAEQHQYRPTVGDTVAFEINQELLIESTVIEMREDGVVLDLDQRSISVLENAGLIQTSEAKQSKPDVNFTPDDIKHLGSVTDLQAMKDAAFELISKPSAYPMKPEKVSWFQQTLATKKNSDQVLKMMWDLYLAGVGMSVMGSTSGTGPNSYRKTFGEDRKVRQRYLEILHNIGFENSDKGNEARKTWKAITGQTHPATEDYDAKERQRSDAMDSFDDIVRSSDRKYRVEHFTEEFDDVAKIYHYLEGPGVQSGTTVDWSPYEKMTTPDLDLYVKLDFPTRKDIKSIGPLDSSSLRKLAQQRGVTDVSSVVTEAEYQGRKVQLGKPKRTPGGPKKFSVYVKNPKTGNIKKVNFGDPNMEIKRDDPERRKNFRARHGCGTSRASDRTKAKYWSCKNWSSTPISKIVKEAVVNDDFRNSH
jgi:hypothetical protein